MSSSTTVYEYTDDSWIERDSGLHFACFNAVGWIQNGSATCEHELCSQALLHFTCYDEDDDCMDVFYIPNPYEHFTLQELYNALERNNIIIRKVV